MFYKYYSFIRQAIVEEINNILELEKIKNPKSKYVLIEGHPCLEYVSDSNGWMDDDLYALGIEHQVAYFCERPSKNPDYDFEEDKEHIIADYMFLQDLTIDSLAEVNKILTGSSKWEQEIEILRKKIKSHINKLKPQEITSFDAQYLTDTGEYYSCKITKITNIQLMTEEDGCLEWYENFDICNVCEILDHAILDAMMKETEITTDGVHFSAEDYIEVCEKKPGGNRCWYFSCFTVENKTEEFFFSGSFVKARDKAIEYCKTRHFDKCKLRSY